MAETLQSFADFLGARESVVVLSGAGISTASGIPDYRDEDGNWKQAAPMQFAEFSGSDSARQRYWARSYVGWQRFGRAAPNAAHRALTALESAGVVSTIITQNVDGLHRRAGSRGVIDLHGDLGRVRCLDCDVTTSRSEFQARMQVDNPEWHATVFRFQADGDAQLAESAHRDFVVPPCEACDGVLKPDVVMFGESVPKPRVARAFDALESAEALFVVGTSLMVYSGFRFVRRAHERSQPVAIMNRGRTRGDELASIRIDVDCSEALPEIARQLAA